MHYILLTPVLFSLHHTLSSCYSHLCSIVIILSLEKYTLLISSIISLLISIFMYKKKSIFMLYTHNYLMLLNLVNICVSTENSTSGMRPPTLNIFPSQPMHVEPSSSNSKV